MTMCFLSCILLIQYITRTDFKINYPCILRRKPPSAVSYSYFPKLGLLGLFKYFIIYFQKRLVCSFNTYLVFRLEWLRALAALPDDTDLIPSTHMVT